ncbi:LytR/AlgR family response regulator transcription factor [Priestia megaterium]|uniref:LytR/AlgR family response regulator transcription factor n=2 Tax=Priestia megaterium TaxID=1404 RepID=UPI00189D5796|nr:LytTR family DNA-binding domain-containing protein [Priestia megaterium]MCU7741510.1 LytTR family transcriptional regulator [Priestia megaterium]
MSNQTTFIDKEKKLPINNADLKICIKYKGTINIINLNEISYIERVGRKTFIHLSDGNQITCNESLKSLNNILENYGFYRIHQSFIVAIDKIKKVEVDHNGRDYIVNMQSHNSPVWLSKYKYQQLKALLWKNSIFGISMN